MPGRLHQVDQVGSGSLLSPASSAENCFHWCGEVSKRAEHQDVMEIVCDPILEGLAQDLQDVASELRQFIQKEHSMVHRRHCGCGWCRGLRGASDAARWWLATASA